MKRAVLALAALCWLALPAISSAGQTDYKDEAVQALQSGTVYISPLAAQVSTGTSGRLESEIGNSDIAVAVFPGAASSEVQGKNYTFVREIATETGHKTVMVVVGDDLEAGSSFLPAGLAMKYAKSAEGNNGSVEGALQEFIGDVKSYRSTPLAKQHHSGGEDTLIYILVPLAAAVAATGVAFRRFRSKKQADTDKVEIESAPGTVKSPLNQLLELRRKVQDQPMRDLLAKACKDTDAYFARAKRAGRDTSADADQFSRNLQKLLEVVGTYVDIQVSPPDYYQNREQYLASGAQAVKSFSDYVVDAIQKGNLEDLSSFRVNAQILDAQRHA